MHRNKCRMQNAKCRMILYVWLILAFLVVFLFSAYQIYGQITEQKQVSAQNEALVEETVKLVEPMEVPAETEEVSIVPPITVDFDALLAKHPDVVGWLYCEGTGINHPVAQGVDNEQYLRSLLDGTYNRAGTIFMDSRNAADFSHWNTVIYGHNMKDDTMFALLPSYADQAFYEQHPSWWLLTPEQNYRVDLFAGYTTEANALLYTLPEGAEEQQMVLGYASRISDFETKIEPEEDARFVTFSTCLYDREDSRYVLMGILKEAQ